MAEFLRLAGDAVKKRETAILEADDNYSRSLEADDNYFLFNGAQCRRLWKHLSAVSCAFAPSLSYSPPVQQKCLPLHKEFFNIVLRADEIAGKCSDEQSWLKEAIFLGGSRQVFQELSADLQSCMRNFHSLTRSLWHESQIPAPSCVIDVSIPEAKFDEDLHKDVTSLMRRVKEREVYLGETHLARYIVDRGEFLRVQELESEPEPDNLDPAKPKKLPFYEVHREDSLHVKNIAQGSYGIVSEVKWLGLICAKKEFLNVESTVEFVKEVGALAALDHSRTVKLLCSNGKVPTPYFIMEFMPTTLERFCKRENASDSMRFEILPSINMMLQISSGMEYLHENGVVHRDLKSANILVRGSQHEGLFSEGYVDVKLTDFGLAKMKVPDESMVASCRPGTTLWSAPEVLGILSNTPKPRIDWRKADTYSFAIVCSEILTGRRPYIGEPLGKPFNDRVISGDLRPKLPKDCPIYLSEFLSRCWAHNPKGRPTFKEITQMLNGFKMCLLLGTVPERARNPKARPTFKITQMLNGFKMRFPLGTVPERALVREVPSTESSVQQQMRFPLGTVPERALVREVPSTESSVQQQMRFPLGTVPERALVREVPSTESSVEQHIERSKNHWSTLGDGRSGEAEWSTLGDGWSDEAEASNKLEFMQLQRHPTWGTFFTTFGNQLRVEGREGGKGRDSEGELVVGEKFAEGGQAELFHAKVTWWHPKDNERDERMGIEYVVKVFKKGTFLRDLKSMIPHGLLQFHVESMEDLESPTPKVTPRYFCKVLGGILLKNGQFAFLMQKEDFDLRSLIERNMEMRSDRDCGPFSKEDGEVMMYDIALGLEWLHNRDIIHRHLNASNVLVEESKSGYWPKWKCFVADYECSIGVVGTGFFRAPEILQACKERMAHQRPEVFSRAADVYAYGMTCYEVLTGKLPFEDHPFSDNKPLLTDLVIIHDLRPQMPEYIEGWACELLKWCWQCDPSARPRVEEILNLLSTSSEKVQKYEKSLKKKYGKDFRFSKHHLEV